MKLNVSATKQALEPHPRDDRGLLKATQVFAKGGGLGIDRADGRPLQTDNPYRL